MKFEKKSLTDLPRCYAAATILIGGKPNILFATEGEGACYAFSGDDFADRAIVWEGPGGTMSMVPIPGTDGEFLAVQKFLKLFQWEEAVISWVKPRPDGRFEFKEILHLPYIHRFDLFEAGGRIHFLGCTLAGAKESRDDWTRPGKIYVGELCGDWNKPLEVRVFRDGLFRNHGYARSTWKGRDAGLVTSDEGAFALSPPSQPGAEWTIERFMDWPISDIAACDIDQDGELEYATIEPWHGELFRVYRKVDGVFTKIYEHPEVAEFYHVAVAATLRGRPSFIGGCRRGSKHLFCLQAGKKDPLALEMTTIETEVGPSNVAVLNEGGRDVIICANREKGEGALYFVTD